METETLHEKNRLQSIEEKVKDVQNKLSTRLPAQYRHLAAIVCGKKWQLHTFKPQDAAAIIKKVRLELGAFDYRVKEQAELLTRYLIELDGVLSYGNADIKSARKALVLLAQQLLPQADQFKERSGKLKRFGERIFSGLEGHLSAPSTPIDSGIESDDMHMRSLFEESGMEEESQVEASEEDASEDEELVDDKEDIMEQEREEEERNEEDVSSPTKSPQPESVLPEAALDIDVKSLPVWRPYYQLQRRQDGVYLLARLNITDPRNVRVQWNNRDGVLRITGFRLPTQKDIVMSRLSGAPTFGRFEIVEQFPPNMLNMEEASQQIMEDGTLRIRLPYNVLRHPLHYRPASLFQPQDCFVW